MNVIISHFYTQITSASYLSIFIRMTLAAIVGGFIGLDRVKKRRPAGIKTHALVCLGSALVMVTSEFISIKYSISTDITRMPAQVISGIGFLGAGTIIVTGKNQIKGLTTAASLWFTACCGLAIGVGFYFGTILSVVLLLLIVNGFSRIDYYFQSHSRIADYYIELKPTFSLNSLINFVKESRCKIITIDIERGFSEHCVFMTLYLPESETSVTVREKIADWSGVINVEDI